MEELFPGTSLTMPPGVGLPEAVAVRVGKALTGRVGFVAGQDLMKREAKE